MPRIQSFPIKEEVRQVFISFLAMLDRVSVELETKVRVEESDLHGDSQDQDFENISFFSD